MEEKKIQHYDCFFDREPSKSNLKPYCEGREYALRITEVIWEE